MRKVNVPCFGSMTAMGAEVGLASVGMAATITPKAPINTAYGRPETAVAIRLAPW